MQTTSSHSQKNPPQSSSINVIKLHIFFKVGIPDEYYLGGDSKIQIEILGINLAVKNSYFACSKPFSATLQNWRLHHDPP